MTLHLVAFRQTRGGDTTEVWFANNNAAQVYHNSLRGIVAELSLDKVRVPVDTRNSLATWLNSRHTCSSAPISLADKVLEAHINAKTVHLLAVKTNNTNNKVNKYEN